MLPFAAARAIVQKLQLKSHKEWLTWCKPGQRPSNIPSAPNKTYRVDGWISWPDWLGYETTRAPRGIMLPFTEARAIVRKLKMVRQEEWREWSKSEQRPSNIPTNPDKMYRSDGWISMPDWLGYDGRAVGKMLPFPVAWAIVRKLELRSNNEWMAWSKSGQRPFNIPSNPHQVYRDDGWISLPDWLGYGSATGVQPSSLLSSSINARTAKKKKRKRRPAAPHPDSPPPPPPPKRRIKTEDPRSSNSNHDLTDPLLRKIKKEEDA